MFASSTKAICFLMLLSPLAQAVPIEFRMDFEVKEEGFDFPVGTTAFVSAIYDSDAARIPPIITDDPTPWFQGETLTIGVGDDITTQDGLIINVASEDFLRMEVRQTMIFVVGHRSASLFPHGLPLDDSDVLSENLMSREDLLAEGSVDFVKKFTDGLGFEFVGASVGLVPEPGGAMLLVLGLQSNILYRRRYLRSAASKNSRSSRV